MSPPAASTSALTGKPVLLVKRLLAVLTVIGFAQAAAWPLAHWLTGGAGVEQPILAWIAWWMATISTGLTLLVGWWRRQIPPRVVYVNTAAQAVALLLGGIATAPGYGTSYAHPTFSLAVGAGVVAAVCLPRRTAAAVLGGLCLAFLVGIATTLGYGAVILSSLTTEVVTLLGVPALAAWLVPTWLQAGQDQQLAERQLEAARATVRAAEAREVERAKQYRVLHDTVLSTLSALSRGTLDPQQHDIRRRISTDADYLRGLIATTDSAAGMYLVGELARMTREQDGLRVHPHISDVPDDLPVDVVRAVSDCIREALANVVRHSGTSEAWVTIVGATPDHPAPDEAKLVVTVTDRGSGFEVGSPSRGLGVKGSIVARMTEAGGVATVDSEPGQGTTVELRWPG